MLGLKLTRPKSKEGAFMINSIQHFQEQGVKNLIEIFSYYTDDLTKFAEMVYGVTKEVTKLGLSLIEEELESYDELLRKRQDLRKGWYIERRDETKLLTSLGEICYSRTYFRMNRTVSTYIRGLIFFSLALPVITLMMVQEMMPMAIPSEML